MKSVVQYETPFHLWTQYGTYGRQTTSIGPVRRAEHRVFTAGSGGPQPSANASSGASTIHKTRKHQSFGTKVVMKHQKFNHL